MANVFKLKRSAVTGNIPTTAQLDLGEIAINTFDGKMFIKRDNGTPTVIQIGDVVGPASATDNALARFDATTGKLIQNSTATLSDTGTLDTANLTTDYIQIDTAATPPTIVPGILAWNDGDGTLDLGLKGGNVTLQLGQEQHARVYNDSGSTLNEGEVVYISGSQGNRIAVKRAQANSEATSAYTLGMVTEPILNGAEGYVTTNGLVNKLNTSTLTAGAIYLSASVAGAYTQTKPTAPNHIVVVGFVNRISTTVGSIYIKVDNGYEIDELHDVLVSSYANGQLLIRDQTAGVWKNATLTAGTGISITNSAGAVTITNSAAAATSIYTGTTAPGSPINGTLWWNSEEGKLKVYYTDANTSQWVDSYTASVGSTGTPGDVVGPASSTDNSFVRFDGTTGKLIQNASSATLDDSGNATFTSVTSSASGTFNTLNVSGTDAEILLTGITTEPSSPASNNLYLYSKNIGGRMMVKQKGPSGIDTPLQPSFYQNKMSFWSPAGDSTTVPAVWGFNAFSAIVSSGTTTTTRNVSSTNILTRSKRLGYVGSGTNNYYTGIYHPNAQWTLGTGSGLGGFYCVIRFALPAGNSSHAFFVGLGSGTSNQSNGTAVDPATLTNSIGVGASTGDTNMRIMYGGSSAQTPITTNTNFSKTASTSVFELIMFAPTNSNNTVNYRLSRFVDGSTTNEISGTLTGTAGTALPSSTTFLTPRLWSHCGSTTTAAQLDIISIYLETDY